MNTRYGIYYMYSTRYMYMPINTRKQRAYMYRYHVQCQNQRDVLPKIRRLKLAHGDGGAL